jgi:phosphoribosyl-ATP pyrophosphohydrolase/phosphoribosyl-AMP cyclohydrolase
MVAWMNAEALQRTLETGLATFYSRSRSALWQKGETSGNGLVVLSVYADCDADTLLLLVDAAGPSCHTGRPTCFFRRVHHDGSLHDVEHEAGTFLMELECEILERKAASAGPRGERETKSYTRTLLDGGAPLIGAKIQEEALELSTAIASESDDRVANEAADVLYHVLVGLRLRDVPFRRVIEVLASRAGTSGLVEKASRSERKEQA